MDSSLFFQFLNVIARNKASDSEQLRSAFSLALAAHELSTSVVTNVSEVKVAVSEVKVAVPVTEPEQKSAIVEVKEESKPVVQKKLFNQKAQRHIRLFNELIRNHLDMRSNTSKEKARVILAEVDGCLYDELDIAITKALGKKG